jgi:hypothetical protein
MAPSLHRCIPRLPTGFSVCTPCEGPLLLECFHCAPSRARRAPRFSPHTIGVRRCIGLFVFRENLYESQTAPQARAHRPSGPVRLSAGYTIWCRQVGIIKLLKNFVHQENFPGPPKQAKNLGLTQASGARRVCPSRFFAASAYSPNSFNSSTIPPLCGESPGIEAAIPTA